MSLSRRSLLSQSAAAALTASSTATLATGGRSFAQSADARPNFIFLLADDMRWDSLGVAGNRIVHTPNLDRLAIEGTLFLNSFVTTSICPVSRASILTGQYARHHGVWGFSEELSAEKLDLTYPQILRAAGYRTGFIGKWGIGGKLPENGFDFWRGFDGQGDYFDPTNTRTDHLEHFMAGQALDFLSSCPVNQPFCLSVSFKAPHAQDGASEPFQPDQRFTDLYRDVTIPRPATATEEDFGRLPGFLRDSEGRARWKDRFSTDALYQKSVKQYYQLVTGLDAAVGKILRAVGACGALANTYIIFSSDNGYFLGEHGLSDKWWGFEEAIRVPLIVRSPKTPNRQLISAMKLNIDIAPTMLDLAGIAIPAAMQGSSLAGLWSGKQGEIRDAWLYEHFFQHPAIAKSEGVRTRQHKYLVYPDYDNFEMLFDLDNDPFEQNNLATAPDAKGLLERMKQILVDLRVKAQR